MVMFDWNRELGIVTISDGCSSSVDLIFADVTRYKVEGLDVKRTPGGKFEIGGNSNEENRDSHNGLSDNISSGAYDY